LFPVHWFRTVRESTFCLNCRQSWSVRLLSNQNTTPCTSP
jgi:hypothetical protein